MLVEIDDNPIPQGIRTGTLLARKHGKEPETIRYAIIDTKVTPRKGTIICLHGRNECIEKYFETANDLTQQGFTFVTFDWRGQGGSSRFIKNSSKGFVRNFQYYRDDLNQVLEEIVLPDCSGPYFIIAHSTGALIALSAAQSLLGRISRMVLLAPFLGMINQPVSTSTIGGFATVLKWLGLGKIYMAGGARPREAKPFEQNMVTTDKKRYARNAALFAKKPDLFLGGPTASWVSAAAQAIRQVRSESYLASLHMPILMLIAGKDRVVDNQVIHEVSNMIPGGKTIPIDGANHEILQDKDYYREQAMAAILAFIPGEDTVVPQKTSID